MSGLALFVVPNEGVGLVNILLQLGLSAHQLRLLLLQRRLVLGELLAGGLQVGNDLAVVVHDLADEGQPRQQIGKVGGLEDHRPVRLRAPLLLRAHLPAEQRILLLLLGGQLHDARLGLVGLLLNEVHLVAQGFIALIQQLFLLQNLVFVGADGLDLVLQRLLFLPRLLQLLAEAGAVDRRRQSHDYERTQHARCA